MARPGRLTTVVIQAEQGWHRSIREGRFDFFVKLEARLKQEGLTVHLVDADTRAARLLAAEDTLSIVVGERPAYGPRVLHAMPTYIWGFWYLDETGIHWNSSQRLAGFNPAEVDGEKAAYFFNGVTGYMLRENVSKFPQPGRAGTLPPGKAVIFCQEIEGYRSPCHYLTTEEMIRTCAAAGGRTYVKLHPGQSKPRQREIRRIVEGSPGAEISDASIHDLTAASELVVTQNSAAGFEALMQRKPVVTCAKCDFHHATLTARTPRDLTDALAGGAAAMADFPYDKYLYWFLNIRCLEPAKDDFADRAWARIREKCLI